MNTKETIDLISKQWCDFDDFKKLSGLGYNSAWNLKKEIREELTNQGYILPRGLVPMSVVIKKLHIDINQLKRIAELQSNIKGD